MTLETVYRGTRSLKPCGGEACVPHSPPDGRALRRTAVGRAPAGRGPLPRHDRAVRPRLRVAVRADQNPATSCRVSRRPSGGRALLRHGRRCLTTVGCAPAGRGPFSRHGGMIDPRGGRSQMKNYLPLIQALIDALIVLEFAGSDEINPDTAVRAMEHIAASLSTLDPADQLLLRGHLHQIAADAQDHAYKEFISSLPDVLGLVQ